MSKFRIACLGGAAVLSITALSALADHPHNTAAKKSKPAMVKADTEAKSIQRQKAKPMADTMMSDKSMSDKMMSGEAKKDEDKWDVMNPPGKKRDIKINVTEGTWMSLDVSPDGKTIAFDLLGDIYTMPITGGTATNISSGLAWEIQPRFSPDGSQIAFTSDRAGGDNIWIMDMNGENKKQVTKETFRLLNNPTWSPDGQFIAARKHFTTSRSLGTGEIWLYHTSGGTGVKLVKKPSEAHQKELGEPMFSPDGEYIYYSQNTTRGPIFEYAQNSNQQLFQIKRYELATGDITVAAGGAGGAVRPAPSPDGQYLAYVKRVRAKSKLFIKNIKSSEERMVFDHLDQDMQETWAVQGVYPNMDWSPDSLSLYFWANGQIHKIDIADNNIEHIDFKVVDTRTVMDAPRPKVDVAPKMIKTKMPRFTAVSPNDKQVVFESLGKLYLQSKTGGPARRLTKLPDTMLELYPSWSRDGKHIIFTSWNDNDLGHIHSLNIKTRKVTTLSKNPGHYARPVFSPSGDYIAYEKNAGGFLTAPEWSDAPGLYVMAVDGGDPVHIRKSGGMPHFDGDELRVYFTDNTDNKAALISTNLLGDDERVHASSKLAQSFHVAPDGKSAAFRENYNLFVMPILTGPQNIAAGPASKALPVRKVSTGGAQYPSWSGLNTLNWSLGPTLFSVDISTVMDEEFMPVTEGISLERRITAAKPDTKVALTGARIITMKNNKGGVIENGTILINGDRITRVGNKKTVVPEGYKTLDLTGKTIIPGLIDAHAHGPQGTDELVPQQNWSTIAHLALGVTTIFDPSSRASEIFVASEMQRAGKILAPRIFSTGEVIYGAKAPGFFADIQSFNDANEHVNRLKQQGAHGVKNYNQPRRDQRQQVVKAARENNLLVVAEGASLYHMDMSLVADGNSSVEHNLPTLKIYDDAIQMYAQTNVAYTPTLAVTYGGIRGEDFYYQESEVWKHPLLSKHVPPTRLQARAVRRQMAPLDDYADDDSAAGAKQLADAGVLVSIGAHGQREGLAAHWEMWSFARGGMDPVQTLSTATTMPAKHLGFDKDLGSLEKGKLADLVILSDNPLDNIRHTEKIEHVMIGGRLYAADTMNEVLTGNSKRAPYFWEK